MENTILQGKNARRCHETWKRIWFDWEKKLMFLRLFFGCFCKQGNQVVTFLREKSCCGIASSWCASDYVWSSIRLWWPEEKTSKKIRARKTKMTTWKLRKRSSRFVELIIFFEMIMWNFWSNKEDLNDKVFAYIHFLNRLERQGLVCAAQIFANRGIPTRFAGGVKGSAC